MSGRCSLIGREWWNPIFHSVKFAIYFPEQDTESILRELRRLAQNGASGCIRYKAYLAAEYLQNKKLLTAIKKKNYKDSEQFFRLLNENYQRQIFLAESE